MSKTNGDTGFYLKRRQSDPLRHCQDLKGSVERSAVSSHFCLSAAQNQGKEKTPKKEDYEKERLTRSLPQKQLGEPGSRLEKTGNGLD